MWAHYDKDGNGHIDQSEALPMMKDCMKASMEAADKLIDKAWDQMPKEEREMVESMGMSKKTMHEMFSVMKKKMEEELKKLDDDDAAAEMFKEMDTDRNGKVDRQEFDRFLDMMRTNIKRGMEQQGQGCPVQ